MNESGAKICIYPGCERPAVAANPHGGPQPAFCDLEEHNALTAHQERQRLASEIPTTNEEEMTAMADEAYRAVFLRVHPTGKMVLSLTTESDGKEGQYAQLVADELGVPALDVKVVPVDTDRFGVGHGYNTSPSAGTSAAIVSATEKIRAKGQLLAGMALDAPPETLEWQNGAWSAADSALGQAKTLEDIALYAHGTGALPPGVEGGLDAQTVYRD
jgi:carbon-monoxide dehydrogenase large subunit